MTPMQAVANSLTLDDIPEPFKDLLTLESTLISKMESFYENPCSAPWQADGSARMHFKCARKSRADLFNITSSSIRIIYAS